MNGNKFFAHLVRGLGTLIAAEAEGPAEPDDQGGFHEAPRPKAPRKLKKSSCCIAKRAAGSNDGGGVPPVPTAGS